ncbi:MAG: hypothetical protein Q9213_006369 [Squamulea squamosa]
MLIEFYQRQKTETTAVALRSMLVRSPEVKCQGGLHVMPAEFGVILQSALAPRTLRVKLKVVRFESLLRATELLVLHTEEVLIRVGIEVFASGLSGGKLEVADIVIRPDVFLVGAPMLLQAIGARESDPASQAVAIFMPVSKVCGTRVLVIKSPIAFFAVAVAVPVANMLL